MPSKKYDEFQGHLVAYGEAYKAGNTILVNERTEKLNELAGLKPTDKDPKKGGA